MCSNYIRRMEGEKLRAYSVVSGVRISFSVQFNVYTHTRIYECGARGRERYDAVSIFHSMVYIVP